MSENQAEMPRYQCHKIVHALKIKALEPYADMSALMTPEDEGYGPVLLSAAYCAKHEPHAGGYYVVYDDGYASFSPAKAFEEGYTRLEPDQPLSKTPATVEAMRSAGLALAAMIKRNGGILAISDGELLLLAHTNILVKRIEDDGVTIFCNS